MDVRKFDTKVQHLKYKVLREVAKLAWEGTLSWHLLDLPQQIIPGKIPTIRCCVYKERAIIAERIKLAMGGDRSNPNVIEVLDIACDECPMGGYEVTGACRGCLAHHCEDACPRDAIIVDANHIAHIDKTKCIECGRCAKVCPYSAILQFQRPCVRACKVKAISMNEDKAAEINQDKCIACGACVYQCPWGAIMDKSFILDTIEILKNSDGGRNYPVYAVVAPSIASQFSYAKPEQVVAGLYALGFTHVAEAALGADMVAWSEAAELAEKGFLTSSCCPAFVDYVKKQFPDLAPFISHNLSPMATIGRHIKTRDPNAKIVFIGPCTAKKMEIQKDEVRPYIDNAITFEELQALFDSRELNLDALKADVVNDASYYGRSFAHSGGVSGAVAQAIREQGLDFDLKAVPCDGIEACRAALLKAAKRVLDGNFIEGMACEGGCIGGAGCLTHGEKNRRTIEQYSRDAVHPSIEAAIGAANS